MHSNGTLPLDVLLDARCGYVLRPLFRIKNVTTRCHCRISMLSSGLLYSGRQVPIFSYFSRHTPIFPIF